MLDVAPTHKFPTNQPFVAMPLKIDDVDLDFLEIVYVPSEANSEIALYPHINCELIFYYFSLICHQILHGQEDTV